MKNQISNIINIITLTVKQSPETDRNKLIFLEKMLILSEHIVGNRSDISEPSSNIEHIKDIFKFVDLTFNDDILRFKVKNLIILLIKNYSFFIENKYMQDISNMKANFIESYNYMYGSEHYLKDFKFTAIQEFSEFKKKLDPLIVEHSLVICCMDAIVSIYENKEHLKNKIELFLKNCNNPIF